MDKLIMIRKESAERGNGAFKVQTVHYKQTQREDAVPAVQPACFHILLLPLFG